MLVQKVLYIIMVAAFSLLYIGLPVQALAPVDTTKTDSLVLDTAIVYTHVNIRVETEWGEPETYENVRAMVTFVEKMPHSVVFKEPDKDTDEFTLIEGMTVRIISRDSGKIIKTLQIKTAQ